MLYLQCLKNTWRLKRNSVENKIEFKTQIFKIYNWS